MTFNWKKIIATLIVTVLVVGGGYAWWKNSQERKAQEGMPQIDTAEVERKDLRVTVSASGVIEPLTTVEVKSRVGGEIISMFVEAGDAVEAGQIIAQVDPESLESQVRQTSEDVAASQARAEEAKLTATVQKTTSRTGISRAEADLATARAGLRESETQLAQSRETTASDVTRAEAQLASSRAELSRAEAQLKAEKERQKASVVRAEAALEASRQRLARERAGARPEEIAQAEANLRNAESAVTNAKVALDRQSTLMGQGFVAAQEVDNARRTYEQALASRDASRESLQLLRSGSRTEDIALAQADMDQARASLELAKVEDVNITVREREMERAGQSVREAEASLEASRARLREVDVRLRQVETAKETEKKAHASLDDARAGTLNERVRQQQVQAALADLKKQTLRLSEASYDLQFTQVTAPRSGVIMEKLVEAGTVIPAGTAALREGTSLVTIADTSLMFVLANVDETDIEPIKVGQPCEINVASMPNRPMMGEVVKIYPLGQEVQSIVQFQVKVQVIDPSAALRPGMTADLTILVAEEKNVLVVPEMCITRNRNKATVQVMAEGAEAPVEREVELGLTNWDETQIVEGLKEGEVVLIPPPPGTELPWMTSGRSGSGGGTQRTQQQMLRQFR